MWLQRKPLAAGAAAAAKGKLDYSKPIIYEIPPAYHKVSFIALDYKCTDQATQWSLLADKVGAQR